MSKPSEDMERELDKAQRQLAKWEQHTETAMALLRGEPVDPVGDWEPALLFGLRAYLRRQAARPQGTIDIVFDGPPGPLPGRFVEAEVGGESVHAGEWVKRSDGYWVLRIPCNEDQLELRAWRVMALWLKGEDCEVRSLQRDEDGNHIAFSEHHESMASSTITGLADQVVPDWRDAPCR